MDSSLSPSSSSGSSSRPCPEAMMERLKSQLEVAYAEEFLQNVEKKCHLKRITKPGTSMSGSESSCISRCVDRYIEATGIVSGALFRNPHSV
ncbi:hypothetical protein ZIOFF_055543 [Zingiber officinale]|uniref:Mitochondrial import inner membrane translocase subunit n=1 Tax=Zingiber officinale TaxID=94328 RepID=A0A8J5KEP1_ZINOF|nr:hypothetical protein ZIOFF_055543 [Zingiber officinale]